MVGVYDGRWVDWVGFIRGGGEIRGKGEGGEVGFAFWGGGGGSGKEGRERDVLSAVNREHKALCRMDMFRMDRV